jgi:hypothetical protein
MKRHFTSALLALCLALPAWAQKLPDPETYGARLESGDVAKAREWLDAGVPVDYVADRVGTGLMIASWIGNVELMKLYIARGADVNKENNAGEQALMHAAWRGHRAAVDLLLASGAKVNPPPMRWSALHYAAFAGHRDIVARLLERGADINARSTNGSSALMMAVYEGHEGLVKELLARGADRNVKNDRGDGALEWAFKFQRLGIARMVSAPQQFVAAANRPAASWGAPVRSATPPPELAPAQTIDEAQARIRELESIRAELARRGMKDAVTKMDRRISTLREALLPEPEAVARTTSLPRVPGAPGMSEIDELLRTRAALASRGMDKSVEKLDRRIAALRAKRARADMDVPAGALLEVTANRNAPEDQSTRLIIDANIPKP